MVKRVFGLVLISLITVTLYGEVDIDTTLSGVISLDQVGDEDITSSGLATGNLTVKSTGSKYVKSQLTLDFVSMRSYGVLSISKAWIKFRYPLLRVTLGKNRITWGEGAAFNAGDVIFDDYINPLTQQGEEVDLTADELKSLNRTMGLVTFPLGRFSFMEVLYLPYDFPLLAITEIPLVREDGTYSEDYVRYLTPDYQSGLTLDQHSYGGRVVTRVGGVKMEGGYIYNADSELHKPYLSFEGTLLVDWHLSSSINIKHDEWDVEDWKESWRISAGDFYLFDLEDDRSLTMRLEAMVKPFGDWKKDALMLYPEIALVPNEEIALFLRSIINPLDYAAKSTLGLNWKTYQGFSIGSFITLDWEEDVDLTKSLSLIVTHKF